MKVPSLSLEGKVALVTGAKRGIGRAIALAFAEAGADIAVCDYIIEDGELKAVVEEIDKLGQRSLAIQADVSMKVQVDNMIDKVVDEFGFIDILVNNAGISGLGTASGASEEVWDRVININLKGSYLCSQAVSQRMVERKKGNIVNIASVEGLRGGAVVRILTQSGQVPQLMGATPSPRPYNISKAGVIMLTKVLARQLGSYGIRVNAIAPGGIKTEMLRPLWSDPERMKQFQTQIPLGRIGEPEEIGSIALFLVSELSNYITGHTIIADGGLLA